MKAHLILAATALMLGFAPVGTPLNAPAFAQTATSEATVKSVSFAVENMTCALCPVTVKRAMEGVEGVRSVEIDFYGRTATVVFDPSVTDTATIGAASTNAGYPAVVRG